MSVVGAHLGLTVGFLLLWYSAVYTVESLSKFHLFLYLDLYLIDKLGIFHANQTCICLDPHLK